jgi:hypothetical protein
MSTTHFNGEWTKIAKEQGIISPFKLSKEMFEGKHDFEFDSEGRMILDGFDAQWRVRDEYVARRVFEEQGYTAFEVQTKGGLEYLRDRSEFVPC